MTTTAAPAGRVFVLPDLGEGLTEAEVVAWRVSVGDAVQVDQVVVEVETAKAVVEVPCPYAGRVTTLHAAAGEVLPVGRPLITVEAVSTAAADAYREQEQAGSGNVLIGYGTSTRPEARRRRPRSAPAPQTPPVEAASPRAPLVLSPLVRRLARESGVDLDAVAGSGPGGIVLRRDVEAAAAAPGPSPVAGPTDGELRIPIRGVRRAVADKLATSRREIPDVTVWVDADATRLLEARAELNAGVTDDERVSVLALVARITVLALSRFPELNARVDTAAQEIVQLSAVHLGIAAQTDRGLVVPVVRDAHAMSLRRLSQAIAGATSRARLGTLAPAELTGGTVTLNNYGVFGVDGSTPIINHPEAALVGMGRIADKPWGVDGRLELRKVTQLVLAFDHRVCDGATAGGFLRFMADCVESPVRLLAEL